MTKQQELATLFAEKARMVSAVVTSVATLEQAFAYAVEICLSKEACQNLYPTGDSLTTRTLAAPCLDAGNLARLTELCRERGVECIDHGLRTRLGGFDLGFSIANYGIADTGTLVLASEDEEVRLASMLCEVHVAVLMQSNLRATSHNLEQEMRGWAESAPAYTAWITGASRTADIERVLALGVHGPLELHILLCEG